MKKNGILITLIFIITSCSIHRIKKPEQIGEKAFYMLKNINSNSKQNYINNFISIKEIHLLAKNEKVVKEEEEREQMYSLTNEEWMKNCEKNYKKIKEKGVRLKINWQKIQYIDFLYENKIGLFEGALIFKCNDNSYIARINAIYDSKEYKLVEIEWINEYLHEK